MNLEKILFIPYHLRCIMLSYELARKLSSQATIVRLQEVNRGQRKVGNVDKFICDVPFLFNNQFSQYRNNLQKIFSNHGDKLLKSFLFSHILDYNWHFVNYYSFGIWKGRSLGPSSSLCGGKGSPQNGHKYGGKWVEETLRPTGSLVCLCPCTTPFQWKTGTKYINSYLSIISFLNFC